MGDTQPLAGGNAFIGWGSDRWFSEFGPSGKLLLEGEFPEPDQSYRSELYEWTGLPLTAPVGAARTTGAATTVYATWNGATLVASWRVLAGAGSGSMTVVAHAPRSGFQTAIPVTGSYKAFEVQALDGSGHVIDTSAPFSRSPVA
jgi:hypothetical protein